MFPMAGGPRSVRRSYVHLSKKGGRILKRMGTGKIIARRTNLKLCPGQRRAARQLHVGSDADADADADVEGLRKIEEQCKELEIEEREI